MILHDVEQGTDEWRALRLGRPTASEFNRILTPTGKPSAQAAGYRYDLLAEIFSGHEGESFESQWMNRGKALEDEAVSYYEMLTDTTTDPGGFITTDDGRAGCSPDRIVYATGEHDKPIGGLEIKCPRGGNHMRYFFEKSHASKEYRHQVQGCMWVTGLDWWDILSYHPDLPPALVRVERDEEWCEKFDGLMAEFLSELDSQIAFLEDAGYTPAIKVTA